MKLTLFKDGMKPPCKNHTPDIGLDIFMPESFSINSLETKTISLELGVAIPEGFAGMLVPRSSVAAKGLIIQTSIIDPGYTGNIHLIVTNCSEHKQHVEEGMRLCSLVVYSVLNPRLEYQDKDGKPVTVGFATINTAEREKKGLGSSGV